jgi:glutamate synthase (ferredoxin)
LEHDSCGIGAIVNIYGNKSHRIVSDCLDILENLDHRAGRDAAGETGDGVGIMFQISHRFFSKICKKAGLSIGDAGEYGVGMFFFPRDEILKKQAKKMFEIITEKEGCAFAGWREVPVAPYVLGARARECMPCIMQGFIRKPANTDPGLAFDRVLYVIRRVFEKSNDNTYIVSLSSRTLVYKGMFLVSQLRTFYKDLQDPDYETALCIVHSRFSTNTNPSWERAHPYRLIVHNGEINTIQGNANKMLSREDSMYGGALREQFHKIYPVVTPGGSDTAMLDNTLEFLMMNGVPLPMAVMITVPEPWYYNRTMSQEVKDFYEYYATLLEPWDGPAFVLFCDGDVLGAVLDRNGLRPSRYYRMENGDVIISSEVGVLPVAPEKVLQKEKIRPGQMLLIDTKKGELIADGHLKQLYAARQPYGEWLCNNLVELKKQKLPNARIPRYSPEMRLKLQKNFGYTYEEYTGAILSMARDGKEPTGSMGVDTALAVLSPKYQPLFNYFKQLFAQVTNPPIDAIRERIVTSPLVYIGKDGDLLTEKETNCNVLKIENPVLSNFDMLKLRNLADKGLKSETIPITYYKSSSLEKALENLFVTIDKAWRDGAVLLILSDRDVDENHVAIPSLLAVSAVHQYLVRTKKRVSVAIVIESGEPRDVHHFATLLGYGASAINPYLAFDAIEEMVERGLLDKEFYAAVEDYREAVLNGIIKIASKMGISTIQSYLGAQIFEAVGISPDVIDRYFTGTASRIGGVTLEDIAKETDLLHSKVFDAPAGEEKILPVPVKKENEEHLFNPETIKLLQESAREGDYEKFRAFSREIHQENRDVTLRDLMDFRYPKRGIPLDKVESEESIVKRFRTGAMSYGSISQEAHEAIAVAMNTLGGMSNSGEGGEREERNFPDADGRNRASAIKQIASGRFGVTSRYLVSAREIQIKMAQGAKPGEGGQLPGKKVYPWIAETRHSTTGVPLVSPPPHHDIYSIEDLAQLIFDLKNANKYADISVKLAAEVGVGTVAAGVAKCGAQGILISGYDGGTGSAPKSSIFNAALPWELGISEAHQALVRNGLRGRVRLETDGKLLTGRDVAVAAMLGAEIFSFTSAPLVALGCMMLKICHTDKCPFGVATQNPELRKRFKGKAEYVMNYMRFVARELREIMAKLGIASVEDLVGRCDLLFARKKERPGRKGLVDLSGILENGDALDFIRGKKESARKTNKEARERQKFHFHLEKTADERTLLKKFADALTDGSPKTIDIKVGNTDRAFGTNFGSEITRRFGQDTLPEDTFTIRCDGAGGQSFGAFIPQGLTLRLTGDANDYLGKGLSGGKIILITPKASKFAANENVIAGNVALYGATAGKVFINGLAGERFCVRNSGATAVVEGVGDHGCEYMTGGVAVILGPVGRNFAAGMSGGAAFVLDERGDLYRKLNKEMASAFKVESKYDEALLRELIEEHTALTGSERGKEILGDFSAWLPRFKKIVPDDYNRMIQAIARMTEKGLTREQAHIEAFYKLAY